jgi:hypothetical protein
MMLPLVIALGQGSQTRGSSEAFVMPVNISKIDKITILIKLSLFLDSFLSIEALKSLFLINCTLRSIFSLQCMPLINFSSRSLF